ncbi:MAG TPA: DUF411 domain-containing protein [Azospirillaceae bacterium]|nr:DUF411 domain-containing protein [Azospirillaceae bacterium]
MNRRAFLAAAGAASLMGAAALAARPVAAPAPGPLVEVWKSPTCGCCGAWIEHMKAAGFEVRVTETDDLAPVKAARGVPGELGSCHTAVVEGYVLEGHVPAADVRRLLAERPKATGLAVPGMPADAPGMDLGTGEPYDVVLFGPKGRTLFARH